MSQLSNTWLVYAPMPPEVQIALSSEYPEYISRRRALSPEAWDHLAEVAAKDGTVMTQLADRELDRDRLTAILSRKAAKAPTIAAAINANADQFDPELVAAVAKVTAKVAGRLAELPQLPAELRYELSLTAGGTAAAHMVCLDIDPDRVDDRVIPLLTNIDSWWPKRPSRDSNVVVSTLFELATGVAEHFCASPASIPDRLLLAAASSHRLTAEAAAALAPRIAAWPDREFAKYLQMAFAANPRVPLDVAKAGVADLEAKSVLEGRSNRRGARFLETNVSETTDVDLLKWALSRGMTSDYRAAGKCWLIPDAVRSPVFPDLGDHFVNNATGFITTDGWLPRAVADSCAAHLGLPELDHSEAPKRDSYDPDAPVDPVDPGDLHELEMRRAANFTGGKRAGLLAAGAERLGDDAASWRTFLSLGENFTGTVGELLDLVDACR